MNSLTEVQISNIKAWIAALRSKKYLQGYSSMKYQTKKGILYCCLGVAMEIMSVPSYKDESSVTWKFQFQGKNDDILYVSGIPSSTYWSENFGDILPVNILTRYNDFSRLSFEEIANRVEKALNKKMETNNG